MTVVSNLNSTNPVKHFVKLKPFDLCYQAIQPIFHMWQVCQHYTISSPWRWESQSNQAVRTHLSGCRCDRLALFTNGCADDTQERCKWLFARDSQQQDVASLFQIFEDCIACFSSFQADACVDFKIFHLPWATFSPLRCRQKSRPPRKLSKISRGSAAQRCTIPSTTCSKSKPLYCRRFRLKHLGQPFCCFSRGGLETANLESFQMLYV